MLPVACAVPRLRERKAAISSPCHSWGSPSDGAAPRFNAASIAASANCRGIGHHTTPLHNMPWVQEEFGRHKKQAPRAWWAQVIGGLKISHGHGDPEHLESALREAEGCGIEDEHLLQAQSRLRELRTAERQLHSAIEAGDRVHLTSALEEASRNGLKTSKVDEAQRKLQSSKTGALVSAIRSRDYDALKRAISEAEARRPEEVLSQAKDVHRTLDAVAKRVSAALRTLSYEDLRSSVEEAGQYHIVTDDVKKAEGVLSTMSGALETLSFFKPKAGHPHR
eukprot:s1189_g13.t1